MANRLDGKVALVTGGGRGIGRGIAHLLAREGAKVVVNDFGGPVDPRDGLSDGSAGPAGQVAEEIKAFGGVAVPNFDTVATMEGGENIVKTAVDNFGKLDIAVMCAGILRERMIFNMTEEEWDAVIQVHLKGSFTVAKHATILMRQQRSGRLIFTSSGAAWGSAGQPNYAAAKHGIIGLMRSCANGMARYNVTANAILPGGATRMTDRGLSAASQQREGARPPSESAEGTERDPANNAPLVAFLASDDAQHVSGWCFSTGGYRVTMYNPYEPARAIYTDKYWDMDLLWRRLKNELFADLQPIQAAGPGAGRPAAGA